MPWRTFEVAPDEWIRQTDDEGNETITIYAGHHLEVEQLSLMTSALSGLGLDVEYRFGDPDRTEFTPYLDLNTSFHGSGVHVGADASTALGGSGFKLVGKLEYHGSTGGYIPALLVAPNGLVLPEPPVQHLRTLAVCREPS